VKNLFLLSILLLSPCIFAEENICPEPINPSWDKMKERDFSKENTKIRIEKLKEYFSRTEVFADEFLYESLLIIEGGAIRQSVEYWKKEGNTKNTSHWTKEFCKFMKKRAHLVH